MRSGVVEFGDGRYEGDFNKKGQRHGVGIYEYNNGDRYEGSSRDGKRHGRGNFVWANGDRFKGEYRNGNRHGRGSYEWTTGARYDGQYAFGKRQGQGTFRAADGSRYDGWWHKDLKDGHGIMTYPDGRRMEGIWSRGELRAKSTVSEVIPLPPEGEDNSTDSIASSEQLPTLPEESVEPVEFVSPLPEKPIENKPTHWKGTQEQVEAYLESRENGEISILQVKESGELFEGTLTIVLDDGRKRGQVTVVKGLLHGEEILWGEDGEILERNRYENGKLVAEEISPAPERN
ncbi:MAG: hypothetical protein VCA36_09615 [Opitutales bacterium]